MLADETSVALSLPSVHYLTKSQIKDVVRSLFLLECQRSLQTNASVQVELARELVAHLLKPV